jgi:hypothetical protein
LIGRRADSILVKIEKMAKTREPSWADGILSVAEKGPVR